MWNANLKYKYRDENYATTLNVFNKNNKKIINVFIMEITIKVKFVKI